ncbi:MAG: phosphatase PAP2 family protein [Bacteroidales bacterium]|nr:phosphatase PAP2 family protein [Bacteroidales bacterium]
MRISFVLVLIILLNARLGSQNPDIELLRAINSPEDLPSDGFFRFISNSEPYIMFAVPLGMSTAGFIRHDYTLKRNGYTGLAAIAVCGGITIVMKYAINRDRPFITYSDIKKKARAKSPSFPSGHTSGAFAMATSVSLAYPKWYIVVPSYAWAGTVGYSRMHLGVHYPSDVLAGALIGSGCAYLTYKINKKLLSKR